MMRSRSLQRRGAWTALFAVALQLVLSFGHMHRLPAAPGLVSVIAAAGSPQPDGGAPGDAAADICSICVSMHLAGTTVLPPPAPLVVPVRVSVVVAVSRSPFGLPRIPPHAFQTRGPPTA